MAKPKGRPVRIPGLVSRAHFGSKSKVTGAPINLAGLGMPMHQTSRSHKNRAQLDVSVERGIIKMPLENNAARLPHIEWDGSHVQKRFHSGRTDQSDGHHVFTNPTDNRGVALGPYHFHHTLGPHIPCCRSGPRQAAFIVNPYTGRIIALGRPYVFQNQEFFSVNLVARALTVWDTMGASLGLIPILQPWFNAGGSFSACNRGESAGPTLATLGERFSFTYPTWPITGRVRNNIFFNATGNKGGRLQLLCHTTQAELDPYICYAYISLETLREYMLSGDFFTGFVPNMPSNVWIFTHAEPLEQLDFALSENKAESWRQLAAFRRSLRLRKTKLL